MIRKKHGTRAEKNPGMRNAVWIGCFGSVKTLEFKGLSEMRPETYWRFRGRFGVGLDRGSGMGLFDFWIDKCINWNGITAIYCKIPP